MRGRLTDQDLNDYALNELPPDERLYVESMLGVSEECRNDDYQMLELGEMLKEGMQRDDEKQILALDDARRAKVLSVPAFNWRGVVQRTAAMLMLSAATAFTVTRPGFWQTSGITPENLASAGEAVQEMVSDVHEAGFARTVEEFRSRIEQLSGAGSTAENDWQFAAQPAVCTPPVIFGDSLLPEIAEM